MASARLPRAIWLPFLLSRLLWLIVSIGVLAAFGRWAAPNNGIERTLLELWAHWDSAYYLSIAAQGYSDSGPAPTIAFYPLYPLLMRALTLGSTDWTALSAAGVLISNVALALATYWLYHLVEADFGSATAERTIWLMLFFPTSFYMSVVYTEALFLALAVGAFWAARRGTWPLAAALAALAGATRLVGIFLLVPLVWCWWRQRPRRATEGAWLLAAPLGLGSFMLYQELAFGSPFRFQAAVAEWGRSTSGSAFFARLGALIQRIGDMLAGGAPPTALGQLTFEILFVAAGAALLLVGLRTLPTEYSLWLLCGLAVPLLTLQLSSLPRYVAVLFPLYIAAALIVRSRPLHGALVALMGLAQMVLFARWSLGYWVA